MDTKNIFTIVILVFSIQANALMDEGSWSGLFGSQKDSRWALAKSLVVARNVSEKERLRAELERDGMTAHPSELQGRSCELFVKQLRFEAAALLARSKNVLALDPNRDRIRERINATLTKLDRTNGLVAHRAVLVRDIIESSNNFIEPRLFAGQFSPCADSSVRKVEGDSDAQLLIRAIDAVLLDIETSLEIQKSEQKK